MFFTSFYSCDSCVFKCFTSFQILCWHHLNHHGCQCESESPTFFSGGGGRNMCPKTVYSYIPLRRNAESAFFLNRIAMFVRIALRSVPGRVATSLRCAMGRQREWVGGACTHLWCRGPLFCQMPPKVVGSCRWKVWGALELGMPKSKHLQGFS